MEQSYAGEPVLVKTHIVWGLITGLVAVAVTAALFLMKAGDTFWGEWATTIVIGLGILGNAFAFSKANGGAVVFMQVFSSGFKATLVITLLGVTWALLSPLMFPQMKVAALEATQRALDTSSEPLPEDQKAMALNMTRHYFTLIMAAGVLLSDLVTGTVCALVAASLAPKNRMPQ